VWGVNWIYLAQERDRWLECCNKPFGSIKDGECSDKLSDYQLLKEDSDPWNYLVSW
jgi:hypothetical protein